MLDNKENKMTMLIVILLIVVICLELFHLIKLHEVSVNSQLTNFAIYGKDIHRGLKHESERLRAEANNIRNDFRRRNVPTNIKRNNAPIVKSKRYDEKQQAFILELIVPNGLKKEDVGLELRNNVLGITYAGYLQMKSGDHQAEELVSVYRLFEIPQTKATIGDVKYNINGDILTVIVPITK